MSKKSRNCSDFYIDVYRILKVTIILLLIIHWTKEEIYFGMPIIFKGIIHIVICKIPDYKSCILSTDDSFEKNIRAKHNEDGILGSQTGFANPEISLLSVPLCH